MAISRYVALNRYRRNVEKSDIEFPLKLWWRYNVVQKLSDALPYVRAFHSDIITINLSTEDLTENAALIAKPFVDCEAQPRSA
jgi:hypothetical protein